VVLDKSLRARTANAAFYRDFQVSKEETEGRFVYATLAMLVREAGHDVRKAYDGRTVVDAALDYRPNVVLLDIGLPGLNGFEVAKRLRQQPTLQNAVLVAMTGYGQESDRKRSQEAGFDHHLIKPGDFGKVLQILTTVSELRVR